MVQFGAAMYYLSAVNSATHFNVEKSEATSGDAQFAIKQVLAVPLCPIRETSL